MHDDLKFHDEYIREHQKKFNKKRRILDKKGSKATIVYYDQTNKVLYMANIGETKILVSKKGKPMNIDLGRKL